MKNDQLIAKIERTIRRLKSLDPEDADWEIRVHKAIHPDWHVDTMDEWLANLEEVRNRLKAEAENSKP